MNSLKTHLKNHHISVKEASDRTHISQSYLFKLLNVSENGLLNMKVKTSIALLVIGYDLRKYIINKK